MRPGARPGWPCTPAAAWVGARGGALVATLAGALAAALAPAAAHAASTGRGSATAQGYASATIIAPLTLTMQSNLDFGIVASAVDASGTVVVAAGQPAHYTGGAAAVCAADGCLVPHTAHFAVSGEPRRAYTIALPASASLTGAPLLPGTPAASLIVNALSVVTASRSGAGNAGQLDASGADSFDLGGTLSLTPGLPPAHYELSVPVVVTYG